MYDKCYFCLDQLPKLKKESTASFFVNFGGTGVQKSQPTLLYMLIISFAFAGKKQMWKQHWQIGEELWEQPEFQELRGDNHSTLTLKKITIEENLRAPIFLEPEYINCGYLCVGVKVAE